MKDHNLEKPVTGCLGAVVNLFDKSYGVPRNSLLTEKHHRNDCLLSRSKSDVARISSPIGDHVDDKTMVSEFWRNSLNGKLDGTPMKMLIAEAMSTEVAYKHNPPNLVAKLMGLESLPPEIHSNAYSRNTQTQSGKHRNFHKNEVCHSQQQIEYNDVYEIWQPLVETNSPINVLPQNMSNVRSIDEKFTHSEKIQDAVHVLNSNKELFLKVIQESNSMLSQHLHEIRPGTPPTRQITVLRPFKNVVSGMVSGSRKNREKQMKKMSQVSQPNISTDDDNPVCSELTRIVVLKPNHGKIHNNKAMASPPYSPSAMSKGESLSRKPVDDEGQEAVEFPKENSNRYGRDETLLSFVHSNGYIGDESSFCISENEYEMGNLSDLDFMLPCSRYSWDHDNNRFVNPFSSSSYSPESSVCIEAKKRLSERLAMISINGFDQKQKHDRKNSSTLGEMLALSNSNNETRSDVGDCKPPLNCNLNKDVHNSPQNLSRSKSVPVCSTLYSSERNLRVSGSIAYSNTPVSEDLTEGKNEKSSLKGKDSSLFFLRNKKPKKEKSCKSQSKDESRSPAVDTLGFLLYPSVTVNGDTSRRVNDNSHEDCTSRCLHGSPRQCIVSQESVPFTSRHEQPSPNSILVPPFEDDDSTYSMQDHLGIQICVHPVIPNMVEKSPRIESVARRITNVKLGSGPLRDEADEKDFDGPCSMVDPVWVQINKWYEAGPDGSINMLVKEIVSGGEWLESIIREVESLGHEIEGKLLEVLLEEAVVELIGNI